MQVKVRLDIANKNWNNYNGLEIYGDYVHHKLDVRIDWQASGGVTFLGGIDGGITGNLIIDKKIDGHRYNTNFYTFNRTSS